MSFEKATRIKLRFATVRGLISVEDLWDVPLTSTDGFCLDEIAKTVYRSLENNNEKSFVLQNNPISEVEELAFDIVKHVIKVRLEEQEARTNAAAVLTQKKKIISIIASKEDEELASKSIDDLKEMINEL